MRYTDAEISQILINQASGIGSQQPAGAAPVQGTMTGVLGNASAVLSHVRGTIPAIKADFANLSNPAAPSPARAKSAAALAAVAVIVAVLGYAIYQEWQIHIINAPITAAAQAQKAAAEAAVAAEVAKGEAAKAAAAYTPAVDIGAASEPETAAQKALRMSKEDEGCYNPESVHPDETPFRKMERIKKQKANGNCPPATPHAP